VNSLTLFHSGDLEKTDQQKKEEEKKARQEFSLAYSFFL